MSVWLIDHYDSFVYNLARYVEVLGYVVHVVRQDAMTIETLLAQKPSHIMLSPGPGGPESTGISCDLVRQVMGDIPLFGVCLGHQILGHVLGATVTSAKQPLHGQASLIHHQAKGIFKSLPNPLRVGRYHSLIVAAAGLPAQVDVVATAENGEVMALESPSLKLASVQFHPESILTEGGLVLLENFLTTYKR